MMKLLNKRQKSNGGFSLVELIVVIAIMVVLVAVLAPIFTKYIENSRRSTDVQNANSIAESVLADAADLKITGDKTAVANVGDPSAIATQPLTKGNVCGGEAGKTFTYVYNKNSNTCAVYVTGYQNNGQDLTNENYAKDYKDATGAFAPASGD